MNRRFRHRAAIRLIVSSLLIALLSVLQIQAQQQSTHLSRHAKKIHKALTEYPNGSFLHVFFRNGADKFGNLGTISDFSFEFTDTGTSATTSISYEDVDRLSPGSPATGRIAIAAQSRRHRGQLGFLIIIGTATVVGLVILATSRN